MTRTAKKGRILVTGGAGFIGSRLAASLLADGYQVDIADNLRTGDRRNLPKGARFHPLDLGRDDLPRKLPKTGYAAVCHLAGQSSGEKSFDDPLYDFDANARSTLLLAEWAARRGVKTFLYASSMGVYGQPKRLPVRETEPPRPLSHYGNSKLAAERALEFTAAGAGMRACSLRMFSVYGPGQSLIEMRQGMVSIYLAYALRGEPVQVRGSLDRVRDLVYIDDVVAAWRLALAKPLRGSFNVGTGRGTSVRQLLDLLSSTLGKRGKARRCPGTPGDQFAMIADSAKLRRASGWKPLVPLEEGLQRMVAWAQLQKSS